MIQRKGYTYHAFPLAMVSGLAVSLGVGEILRRGNPFYRFASTADAPHRVFCLIIVAIIFVGDLCGVVSWYQFANVNTGAYGKRTSALIDVANRYASGEKIYAFSTHPYPGFPIVSYSTAEWGSRTNSQFVVPAIAKSESQGNSVHHPGLLRAIEFQRDLVLEDFIANQPAMVFVDDANWRHGIEERPFDDLRFFTSDPHFARIWTNIRKVGSHHFVFSYVLIAPAPRQAHLRKRGAYLRVRRSDLTMESMRQRRSHLRASAVEKVPNWW